MIGTSDILDLRDEESLERSNDDQHDREVAIIIKGSHSLLPGRQLHPNSSGHINVQNIGEMTLTEEPNANSLLETDYKDVKVGFEELCPVCGDKVSGYHYGLLTCESCKGFFKRTVQNKKVYACVDNRNCQIDKSQRKRCPFCRFQKCLSVGMKLEAVRSDRMRGGRNKFGPMYKRDRALKQQAARQAHVMDSCSDMPLLNGMIAGDIPESPEDMKPDPIMLQLYAGNLTSSTTSSMMPGLSCMSAAAAPPSSTASVTMSSGGSSPPPAHPHRVMHTNHHPSHQGQLLVPISSPPQGFPQSFGHISALAVPQPISHISALAVPQPSSPKTHYPQNNHHPQNGHQQYRTGNGLVETGDSSPPLRHHQLHQASSHAQIGSGFHVTQNQLQRRNVISPPGPGARESRSSYPASAQVYPKVIEALRAFQSPKITDQTEQSALAPLITEIKASMMDESEVKHKMLSFAQNELSQTDIGCNPEQFLPVLCRIVDQLLFLMVEWARNSSFFKEIKVEDQMKLLHNSWCEILILDFIYRQINDMWGKEIVTPNGVQIGFEILDSLGLSDVKAKVFELIKKGRELKIDFTEYMCLKFLIMLNPDVTSLENRAYIEQSQEKVNAALFEYCLLEYPNMDKYSQLLLRLPEIRLISIRTEDFLYFKHLSNEVPDQTLLTEMLHAKRRG